MKQFTAIVKARTMEFVRDRGTFFWNLIFPVLLVGGFGAAFSDRDETLFKVGLIERPRQERTEGFYGLEQIAFLPYDPDAPEFDREGLVRKVRLHQLDMLIDFPAGEYFLNPGSPHAELLRHLVEREPSSPPLRERPAPGKAIRYVDWLVPGVIGMNMLFSCLFGVGFVIVRYRKNGVLKRIKATPVSALTFISAQMASRFLIVILTSVGVFAGTHAILRFFMLGSYWNLLLLTALAILCMISLGLVFAARIRSEELASGLMNLVTFPMIVFSGVFFSLEGTPRPLRLLSRVFPLTHFVEGARAIMLEGKGLPELLLPLGVLGGMTLLFLGTAALSFHWD